jgi:murein lipoprotein
MKRYVMASGLVLAAVVGLGGCASTVTQEDLAAVQARAEAAVAEAEEAKRLALEAEREAAAAKLDAEQARAEAAAARQQAADTETRIDRMFKKAMYK